MSETVSVDLETGAFADRERIGWLRVLCSGFRPVEGE
jgi:hypothetical protein